MIDISFIRSSGETARIALQELPRDYHNDSLHGTDGGFKSVILRIKHNV